MSDEVVLEQQTPTAGRMRRCVAARTSRPAEGMIRFVLGPDAALVPDIGGRLPGRGMWVSADRQVLATALGKNQFAKVARTRVRAEPGLVEQVEQMLLRRCLDLVGLARRAGHLVAGYDQCIDWLRHGRCAYILTASDASPESLRRMQAQAGGVVVLDPFTRNELGGAIGREEIVHVALAQGGLAKQLLEELGRLHGFREFRMPQDRHALNSNVEEGASRT